MTVFIHPNALVESKKIGEKTRIWAFAHVLPGASIGQDCNICDHVFIENDVIIGDRVTVKCGVQLWDGIEVEDDVFIGPNATFTNDLYPRSKVYPEKFAKTRVQKGASIGANATILPGVTIGSYAMVGAGAVVLKDVPPCAIVVGNPAHIVGYTSDSDPKFVESTKKKISAALPPFNIKGAGVYRLPEIKDLRGTLSFAEINKDLPFTPQRYFVIYDVPSVEVRGQHAHITLHEFLVCIKGSCKAWLDDGHNQSEILLDSPTIGLHIPPMVWGMQYCYSPDAVLLVLASDVYKADDYIRTYKGFQDALKELG